MKRPPPTALVTLGVLVALASAPGCARRDAAPAAGAPHDRPAMRSQALIDSGNAAFRAKDYDGAARRYASAAAVDSADPAAYYGLGMALARLGRDEEARQAYARSRELQARLPDSGARAR